MIQKGQKYHIKPISSDGCLPEGDYVVTDITSSGRRFKTNDTASYCTKNYSFTPISEYYRSEFGIGEEVLFVTEEHKIKCKIIAIVNDKAWVRSDSWGDMVVNLSDLVKKFPFKEGDVVLASDNKWWVIGFVRQIFPDRIILVSQHGAGDEYTFPIKGTKFELYRKVNELKE